jgi:hypothetical protein
MHIQIELLRKGGVNIKKIPPADIKSSDGVSIRHDPAFTSNLEVCTFVMYNNRAVDMKRDGEYW